MFFAIHSTLRFDSCCISTFDLTFVLNPDDDDEEGKTHEMNSVHGVTAACSLQ
jgi:hypothetical protein